MLIQLKDGRSLNSLYLANVYQGKQDKKQVIYYMVNGTKYVDNCETEEEAASLVEEILAQ